MKPSPPMVLGSGPLADAMRRMIDADPDKYRPMTISTRPAVHCPCCGKDVYRVKSRLTNFEEGFATGLDDDAILHPLCTPDGFEVKPDDLPKKPDGTPDFSGTGPGGCIPFDRQSEWKEQPKKKASRKKPSKKAKRAGR